MFWAWSEFDWAFAVVIAVHRETANANAILRTLVVMPLYLAAVLMRGLVARNFSNIHSRHALLLNALAVRFPAYQQGLMASRFRTLMDSTQPDYGEALLLV